MESSLINFARSLADIVNCSLNTGVFPCAFKIAKGCTHLLKRRVEDAANYRPIAVLPFFNEILEELMCERANSSFEKANIYYISISTWFSSRSLPLCHC